VELNRPTLRPRNPGPRWGYHCIACCQRLLPTPLFRAGLAIGAGIGLLVMPRQRRHSRAYWLALQGRPPSWRQLYRHFFAFAETLALKLNARHAAAPLLSFAELAQSNEFEALCASGQPALFGTFHVGSSDMMGCLLSRFGRRVSLIRIRMENSVDTEILELLFRDMVRFIWINQREDFVFSLKNAIEAGESIGLQCDRVEYGGRLEPYEFLGARRLFPSTIYHLAALFELPVVFAFTGPIPRTGSIEIHTSPVFIPRGDRQRILEDGHRHFQDVLHMLENHLRAHPQLWFNFLPLNPPVHAEP
jgi:predicted LPLAT superfamily acyltransferase